MSDLRQQYTARHGCNACLAEQGRQLQHTIDMLPVAQTALEASDVKARLLAFDRSTIDDALLHRLQRVLARPNLTVEVPPRCLLCTTCCWHRLSLLCVWSC